KEIDAVKLWALRGLRELFAQGGPDKSIFKKQDLEVQSIGALHRFIKRPPPPAATPKDELEAFRFVRREAIHALANTRFPVVPNSKPGEGQTALLLLRVA